MGKTYSHLSLKERDRITELKIERMSIREISKRNWVRSPSTLSDGVQEQLRRQGIRLKKKGENFIAIAELLEVHRNTVSKWWKEYQNKGNKGLKSKHRGRREGDQRTLTPEQESTIQELIYDKTPDQYKLTFALCAVVSICIDSWSPS